ncbi:hypothetical protein PInf_019419 [Phytophthora infestans]|nr:hypothetical protein PInf_019419 [Phytophthora infestans]
MAGTDADDAMPRAKRLKMLREAKARKDRGESSNGEAYAPAAAAIQTASDEPMERKDAPQQEEDAEMTTSVKTDDNADDLVGKVGQLQEDDAKTEDESDDELLNLAPKRANWDMERDIAPMLRKLERRTQHAIVEILREKLAAEQQEEGSDDDDGEEDDDEEEEEVDE